jgi:peptidyl-prolyl cis-trans isomerase A (cyclophilin A)
MRSKRASLPLLLATLLFTAATQACGQDSRASNLALLRPDSAALNAPAPDSFSVVLTTTKGEVEIRVRRDWSPRGADRFHYLAKNGFFNDARFFRVLPGFVAQFGLSGVPNLDLAYSKLPIRDDPVRQPNRRGTVVFATAGPDTRSTQLFINYADNAMLNSMGFAPIGEVVRGMEVVDQFYSAYGEMGPGGPGPNPEFIAKQGNPYLQARYPLLDKIVSATVTP